MAKFFIDRPVFAWVIALFILLGGVAVAVFFLSGFFQIKAAEQGVILRFGKLVDVKSEGWGWRIG